MPAKPRKWPRNSKSVPCLSVNAAMTLGADRGRSNISMTRSEGSLTRASLRGGESGAASMPAQRLPPERALAAGMSLYAHLLKPKLRRAHASQCLTPTGFLVTHDHSAHHRSRGHWFRFVQLYIHAPESLPTTVDC